MILIFYCIYYDINNRKINETPSPVPSYISIINDCCHYAQYMFFIIFNDSYFNFPTIIFNQLDFKSYHMKNRLQSSIDVSSSQQLTPISHQKKDKDIYIYNLQQQNQYFKNALKTAQNLISKYQSQCQYLEQEKKKLQSIIELQKKQLIKYEDIVNGNKINKNTMVLLSNRISELLEVQKNYQSKIHQLNQRIAELLTNVEECQRNKQQKQNNYAIKDTKLQLFRKNLDKQLNILSKRAQFKSYITDLNLPKKKRDNNEKIISILRTSLTLQAEQQIRDRKQNRRQTSQPLKSVSPMTKNNHNGNKINCLYSRNYSSSSKIWK